MHRSSLFLFSKSHRLSPTVPASTGVEHPLFRGVRDHSFVDIAGLLFGIPSRMSWRHVMDEMLTHEHIVSHKATSFHNQNYFMSLTQCYNTAQRFAGKHGAVLTLDGDHPYRFVDVEQTMRTHAAECIDYQYEYEHCVMALLFCSIKEFRSGQRRIVNPFHCMIDSSNLGQVEQFEAIYAQYCEILNPKHFYTKEQYEASVQSFVENYLRFFQDVLKHKNPFSLTPDTLAKQHPHFAKMLLQQLHVENDKQWVELFSEKSLDKKILRVLFGRPEQALGHLLMESAVSLFNRHRWTPLTEHACRSDSDARFKR